MGHDKSGSTFNDLIDVAVRALKDNVLESVNLNNSGVRSLKFRTKDDADSTIVFDQHSDYLETVNYIKSLYTETFVIESLADVEKIRLGAKLSQNGFEYEINHSRLISLLDSKLFLLKGATVTQRKGVEQ